MSRTKSQVHFVAIDDVTKAQDSLEGFLISFSGHGGDSMTNRKKALEIAQQQWSEGKIEESMFSQGLSEENIVFIPADSPRLTQSEEESKETEELPPIVQGAQEIIELTRLQLQVEELGDEVKPYKPIIEAILSGERSLTSSEREIVKDKKYSKGLIKFAETIAEQEDYRERVSENVHLILNRLDWEAEQK